MPDHFPLRRTAAWAVCLLLAGALPLQATAAPAPGAHINAINAAAIVPSPATLFAEIGIVAAGRKKQFIVGDNVDGYFDGMTGGYRQRPGYLAGGEALLQDYATYIDDALLDRRSAAVTETVYPYGRTTSQGGRREAMVVHAGARQLSVVAASAVPQTLAVQPLWTFDVQQAMVTHLGAVMLIVPPSGKMVVAVSADQPFELALPKGAGAAELDRSPLLRASQPGTSFTVHFAFSTSSDIAVEQATAMARSAGLVDKSIRACYERLTRSWLWTSDAAYNRALVWAKASALSFLVEEYGKGLWAGLPWFRENWGRDTFISLPGTLLVSGHFRDARDVLENFARYQNLGPPAHLPAPAAGAADAAIGPRASDYGRIPNRVRGEEVIYNTVDGTPWMLREALEYVRYTGDREFAERALKLAGPYIDGALRHSVDADGLLVHEDADTWMDARIEGRQAWSPRGSRAVEIQALWFTALESAAVLAELGGQAERAAEWRRHAARAKASFLRLYWDGKVMADRLKPDGSRDLSVRPNQLMLVSVPFTPFVPPEVAAAVVRNAVGELLFPYGIASLSPKDPYFHPHHVNDAFHHKDAAYHNGTIWGWNAGFVVTALTRFGRQDLAYALSRNLAGQIVGLGTLGTMSELLDALPGPGGEPKPSGTFSQAWSVAEFERNGFQDYLGFRPDLPANRLLFVPALPAAWRHFDAVLPFGMAEEALTIQAQRSAKGWRWRLGLRDAAAAREIVFDFLDPANGRRRAAFTLAPGQVVVLQIEGGQPRLDGRVLASTPVAASQDRVIGKLKFAVPPKDEANAFPMTRGKDVLKDIILEGRYR